MVIELLVDCLTLRLLVVSDLDVALLELLVLRTVLPRDLLVLLADDVCLRTSVLVLQCLLVEELLLCLSIDRSRVDLLEQWNHFLSEDLVESVRPLLKRQV